MSLVKASKRLIPFEYKSTPLKKGLENPGEVTRLLYYSDHVPDRICMPLRMSFDLLPLGPEFSFTDRLRTV